jgi:hypothetical protein
MRTLLVIVCLFSSSARADSDDDTDIPDETTVARQHYQAGLQAFRTGRYKAAIDELNQAYEIKPMPLLLVNIATTYRKLGDYDRAALFLKKYLADAPADAADRDEVRATLSQIDRMRGELIHEPIETAPPDTPVDVRVVSPRRDARVFLYYRASGGAAFTRVPMRARAPRNPAEKIARIPAGMLGGAGMEYYLEARDSGNRVLHTVGDESKPNVVLIDPEAPPRLWAMSSGRHERPVAPQKEDRLAQMDEELAPLARSSAKPTEQRKLGGVFYSGLALAILGAGGVAVGIAGDVIARDAALSLTHDAQKMPPFQFSDPNAPGGVDDASFEAKGKLWNTIGIAGTAAGGALLVTGLTMMIVDGARRTEHRTEHKKLHTESPDSD